MIGEPRWITARDAAIQSLPHPLHLFEWITRSRHYHLGRFERADASLHAALDLQARSGLPALYRGGKVLDVGCGLGGTTRILGEAGFDAMGVDPSAAGLDYARIAAPGVRFVTASLETFARLTHVRFDGVVLNEVLQHFPSLPRVFALLRPLLRPGGWVAVQDVATIPALPRSAVPYHRRGALARAAAEEGFALDEHEELGDLVSPTFAALTREIEERRAELVRDFLPRRPTIEDEIDELLVTLRHLENGFRNGDLVYERMLLCRS